MPLVKSPLVASAQISADAILAAGTLGAEKVTNGDFTSDATGWTLGSLWTYATARANKAPTGTGTLSQTITGVNVGNAYRLSFLLGRSAGTMTPRFGTATGAYTFLNVTGTYTVTMMFIAPSSGSLDLVFDPSSDFNGSIDAVSLKEATVAASQMQLTASGVRQTDLRADMAKGTTVLGAGSASMATGTDNTLMGYGTLALLTSGSNNTAFGSGSLSGITTASNNTAIGSRALSAALSPGNATAIGAFAMGNNQVVSNASADSVAVGYQALFSGGANNCVAIGSGAARSATASNTTAIGFQALYSATSGTGNTAVGSGALQNITTNSYHTAVGTNALSGLTLGKTGCVAVGYYSAGGAVAGSNTTSIGFYGSYRSTGADNTSLGSGAGQPNLSSNDTNSTTSGTRQTLIGSLASQSSNTQRDDVVALGYAAKVDGNNAIAIGSGASAGAAGAVAVGKDSAGTSATTTTQDEIKLGTALHSTRLLGAFLRPVASKTGAYTLTVADWLVLGDATSTAFTLTLPTAVGIAGRIYEIKRINSGANAVTVATTSSQTIDGATTSVLGQQYDVLRVVSDNANWMVI